MAKLDRDRILRTAITLADEGGLESLTMRRLAQKLGVEAMSLYHHVGGKEDLVGGMVDLVVAEMEVAAEDENWKEALRRSAISAHDVLGRHPWAPGLIMSVQGGESRLRYMDALLGALRRGGCSAVLTHHAYHALDSHIVGFTLWQAGMSFTAEELPELARSFLEQRELDAYPHLVEHIHVHLSDTVDDGATEFAFGLDLILDGVERLRDAG
jgi:AcrR family transcriptional regulator